MSWPAATRANQLYRAAHSKMTLGYDQDASPVASTLVLDSHDNDTREGAAGGSWVDRKWGMLGHAWGNVGAQWQDVCEGLTWSGPYAGKGAVPCGNRA